MFSKIKSDNPFKNFDIAIFKNKYRGRKSKDKFMAEQVPCVSQKSGFVQTTKIEQEPRLI